MAISIQRKRPRHSPFAMRSRQLMCRCSASSAELLGACSRESRAGKLPLRSGGAILSRITLVHGHDPQRLHLQTRPLIPPAEIDAIRAIAERLNLTRQQFIAAKLKMSLLVSRSKPPLKADCGAVRRFGRVQRCREHLWGGVEQRGDGGSCLPDYE